jgi:hypothetical protein
LIDGALVLCTSNSRVAERVLRAAGLVACQRLSFDTGQFKSVLCNLALEEYVACGRNAFNPAGQPFSPRQVDCGALGVNRTRRPWLRRPGSGPAARANSRSNTPLPIGVVGS